MKKLNELKKEESAVIASTYQETHSAKWTSIIALYYIFGALLLACIAYHVGLLIW